MYRARLLFAATLSTVCGMAYAIPVPESSGMSGFFSPMGSDGGGFFTQKTSGSPRIDNDEHGRPIAITDIASGHTVHLLRDRAGRVTELHSPTSRSVLLYASDATIRPSTLIRDGVPFRIVTTGEHSTMMQPLRKGTVTADSVDILAINGGGDWNDSCAADPSCADPFHNPFDDFNSVLDGIVRWWSAGAAVGSTIGFVGSVVAGTAALQDIALATALGGGLYSSAFVVFYGGTTIGTWVYGTFGAYFWIRFAP